MSAPAYEVTTWCEPHRKMFLLRGQGVLPVDALMTMAVDLGFAPEQPMTREELLANDDAPVLKVDDRRTETFGYYRLPSDAALLWWRTTLDLEPFASDCRRCHPALYELARKGTAGGSHR